MKASPNKMPTIVEPEKPANWCVIWLHGLGADGNDFEPIVNELNLPDDAAVRFVFPHAPVRPITVNGGMHMRGWYDIRGVELDRGEDAEGIAETLAEVEALIQEQELQVGQGRVILAGFSQGGAIALHLLLHGSARPAAVIALSTYIPLFERFDQRNDHHKPPVFLGHGIVDPVVIYDRGKAAHTALEGAGFDVEWRAYPMPHSVMPEEISHINQFLTRIMSD